MKRGGKAPAFIRQAFRPRVVALLKERERLARETGPNAATEGISEARDVLAWLDGNARAGAPDVKVEVRGHGRRWRASLMVGVGGYSAASPLITIEEI